MAVADPAAPPTEVGAKTFSAPASAVPASATSAAIARMVRRAVIRVTSTVPTYRSPLSADAEREHAFGEGRVPRLVLPHEVVVLVFVGKVGAVHEHFEVLGELVGDRRVEVSLRRLVLFQAGDAAHVCRESSL